MGEGNQEWNILSFVGQLGEDTNRTWKMINDFPRCTEDSFDQDSEILFVFVSDYRGEKIIASLEFEEILLRLSSG